MNSIWLVALQYGCSVADLYHNERNHQGIGNVLIFPEPGPMIAQDRFDVAAASAECSTIMIGQHDEPQRPVFGYNAMVSVDFFGCP